MEVCTVLDSMPLRTSHGLRLSSTGRSVTCAPRHVLVVDVECRHAVGIARKRPARLRLSFWLFRCHWRWSMNNGFAGCSIPPMHCINCAVTVADGPWFSCKRLVRVYLKAVHGKREVVPYPSRVTRTPELRCFLCARCKSSLNVSQFGFQSGDALLASLAAVHGHHVREQEK